MGGEKGGDLKLTTDTDLTWELAMGLVLRREEAAFFVLEEEKISIGAPTGGSAEPTKRLGQGHKAGVLLWLSPVW